MASLYTRAPPSRASASTQCQKCLQRGHYSYECKASVTDRPYSSRPSRTQQLKNPALKPKLTQQKPDDDLSRKAGVADDILAKRGRQRSTSVSSVDSVSTISTSDSRSRSRSRSVSSERGRKRKAPRIGSRRAEDLESYDGRRSRARDRSPSSSSNSSNRESERRRLDRHSRARRLNDRFRSPSVSSEDDKDEQDRTRFRDRDDGEGYRSGKRRSASPGDHDRPSFSRETSKRDLVDRYGTEAKTGRAPRDRSMSPYSRRLALTQAMNV